MIKKVTVYSAVLAVVFAMIGCMFKQEFGKKEETVRTAVSEKEALRKTA